MQTLTALGQAHLKSCSDGAKVLEHVEEMTKDPMKYNREFLSELIRNNKNTEFGRLHSFDKINSIEDFQKYVPISDYDDYADYIERMINGEQNVITYDEVVHYNITSGTTGEPKKIPMTKKCFEKYLYYGNGYLNGLMGKVEDKKWLNGKKIYIIECPRKLDTFKDGSTYGLLSAKFTLASKPYYSFLYTSPLEAGYPKGNYNTKYLHALFALKDDEVSQASGTYASFWLEFLRYIKNNWKMLCDDIEKGSVNKSVDLPSEIIDSVNEQLTPDPERANELRKIFENHKHFVSKVWPNMTFVMTVGTGGFKSYADRCIEAYQGKDIYWYNIGLCASEGMFTLPEELNSQSSLFIPDNIFYEFLPIEAGDDFSKICTLEQLEVGKEYELICTNLSGLYRYRMQDIIKIVGFHNKMPLMQFLQRRNNIIDMASEKTSETALIDAVNMTCEDLNLDLVDFSVYANEEASPMRYDFLVEFAELHGASVSDIRDSIENNLFKTAPVFASKVEHGILDHITLNLLKDQTYTSYVKKLEQEGRLVAQFKSVHIIRNAFQRDFFFSYVENLPD